jgi:hypothetical protein
MKTQTRKVLEVMQANLKQWKPSYFYVGVRKGIDGQVFLSYKAPARLSEIYRDFPDHVERDLVEGTRYFQYKLVKKIIK